MFTGTALSDSPEGTTFSVERVYFGIWAHPTILVRTGMYGAIYNSAFPHPEFTLGQVYTMYTELRAPGATTGACAPSHPGGVSLDEANEFKTISPYSRNYSGQPDLPVVFAKDASGACTIPLSVLGEDPLVKLCVPAGHVVWGREALLGTSGDVLYITVMSDQVAKPHVSLGFTNLRVYGDALGRLWLLGTSGDQGPSRYVAAQRLHTSGSTTLILRRGPDRSSADATSILMRYLDALTLP